MTEASKKLNNTIKRKQMPIPKRPSGESSARRPGSGGPARRPVRRDEPEERSSRRTGSSGGGGASTGRGWGAVAKRRAETAARKKGDENKPPYLQRKHKFYMIDGEEAIIQFINDEPLCVNGANIKSENFDFYVSPTRRKSDPLAENGLKIIWRAGFKLLDYRGDWEKAKREGGKGKFLWNKKVEKYWLVSETVASQLEQFASKKGKNLSELVILVRRSGSDKNTTYNFEMALDDDDRAIRPSRIGEELLPTLEEALEPLPNDELEALIGGGSSDVYEDSTVDYDD